MKYLPLIFGALFRKKWRTFLALLSLTAAFLLLGLGQAVNSLIGGGAEFLGANRLITQARTSFTQPLPMRMLPRIEAVPGVKFVGHSQFFGGVYQDPTNFFSSSDNTVVCSNSKAGSRNLYDSGLMSNAAGSVTSVTSSTSSG